MKSVGIFILLFIIIGLTNCKLKPKSPELTSFENIEMTNDVGDINIKGNIIMNNPNEFGFIVDCASIDVFINYKKVATIEKLNITKIKNKSTFIVPLDITFPAKKVFRGFLSTGFAFNTTKSVTFRMEGEIDYDVKEFEFNQKVKQSQELQIPR